MSDPKYYGESTVDTLEAKIFSDHAYALELVDGKLVISGQTLKEGGLTSGEREPIGFRSSTTDISVEGFMLPAKGNFHLAQDALCVSQISEGDYLFVLGDGVSGGRYLLGVHSGEVSRDVVSGIVSLARNNNVSSTDEFITSIESFRRDYKARCVEADWVKEGESVSNDTTMQLFRAQKTPQGWMLTSISIGDEKDLGPRGYRTPNGITSKFDNANTPSSAKRWNSGGALIIDTVLLPFGSELVLGTDGVKSLFTDNAGNYSTRSLFKSLDACKKFDTNGVSVVSTKNFSKVLLGMADRTSDDASLIHVRLK